MTEEKFTKLTDEDLELVAGGGEFYLAIITPSEKDGYYNITKYHFTGNAQQFADFKAGKSMDSLNVSISTEFYGDVSSKRLPRYIKNLEKGKYEIIRK